jgi:hypothetical protein
MGVWSEGYFKNNFDASPIISDTCDDFENS